LDWIQNWCKYMNFLIFFLECRTCNCGDHTAECGHCNSRNSAEANQRKSEKNFSLVTLMFSPKIVFDQKLTKIGHFFNKNCNFLSIFSLKTSIFQSNFSPAELFFVKKIFPKTPLRIWTKITTLPVSH